MNLRSVLKAAGLLVGVFAVGIAGVFVGSAIRGTARQDAYVVMDPVATTLLKPGMPFPDAAVLSEGGDTPHTADLIGGDGTVFVFLDLECPPCGDMAAKWQGILDQDAFDDLRVIGITNEPPDRIGAFKEEHGVRFPMMEDAAQLFLHEWRVQRFPLEVVVGTDGRIRSVSYDSVNPVDLAALAARLQG